VPEAVTLEGFLRKFHGRREKKIPYPNASRGYGRIYTILIKPASSLAQEEGEKKNQEKKFNITNGFRYQPLQQRETRSTNRGPLQ